MKSNHTKGEWKVNRNNDGNANAVYSDYHGAICSFPNFYGVKPTQSGTDELEANAHLVAAAPDMLSVLVDYVHSILHENEVERWYNRHKNDKEANPVLVKAIAAIQKATEGYEEA